MPSDLTYCETCLRNLPDDQFDYALDRPVCLACSRTAASAPVEIAYRAPACETCGDVAQATSLDDLAIAVSAHECGQYWGCAGCAEEFDQDARWCRRCESYKYFGWLDYSQP